MPLLWLLSRDIHIAIPMFDIHIVISAFDVFITIFTFNFYQLQT